MLDNRFLKIFSKKKDFCVIEANSSSFLAPLNHNFLTFSRFLHFFFLTDKLFDVMLSLYKNFGKTFHSRLFCRGKVPDRDSYLWWSGKFSKKIR